MRASRPRIVIAGLGDTGLLTAIRLADRADVVGISTKPGLLSGQELGLRISRPRQWARDYWVGFDRYRGLDRVRTVQAVLTGVDLDARVVFMIGTDGAAVHELYDVLVISTGVRSGFWRQPCLQTREQIVADLDTTHARLAAARSVIVVGGGAAAMSAATSLATTWPGIKIDLYFPGPRALAEHHPRAWKLLQQRLIRLGVGIHPGHRAELPTGFTGTEITAGSVRWSTGQAPASADAVLWAIGHARPNTEWLPADLRDGDGFIPVDAYLQVVGHPGVFAIGDVASTDPLRASARARADGLLAGNITAWLRGRKMKTYRPPRYRWGSIVGPQPDGLQVFTPNGRAFRFPAWSVDHVLMPWIVRRGIYRGVRETPQG